ncbi:hypothetical protein IGI42_001636 [Enterococcus sp. AZ109]
MKRIKKLNAQELRGIAGGAVAGGCITFGYNKKPKHGWN